MLTLMLSADWVSGRDAIYEQISADIKAKKPGRILIVPELISHDAERRLCAAAGNTASRFAEVLSFSRLVRRVAEYDAVPVEETLDNGGRVVAMAAAARQLHSKLKAYAAIETKPEFLTGLVDAVDEFKRCCISAADLHFAAQRTEGALAQKLEELSLLLEAYNAICAQGKRDPRDQISWLLNRLQENEFAQEHCFYIDGFPDFTVQHLSVLEHLVRMGADVTVSLNCDRLDSSNPAFQKASDTASSLVRCAKRWGSQVKIQNISGQKVALDGLSAYLFQGHLQEGAYADVLKVYTVNTPYDECLLVAQNILRLVRQGVRFRDISVVCADMNIYRNTIHMVFERCAIPSYLSGTESVLDKAVITTVLAAMDSALGGFEKRDMLRYIKSVLSPVSLDESDALENYSVIWNIQGTRWLREWTGHPSGLGEEWTDQDHDILSKLNQLRQTVVGPLVALRDDFQSAVSVSEQIQALYNFLCRIELAAHLESMASDLDSTGDNREAQILSQLWEILLNAMEQLHDVLGNTAWDTETFVRLFKLLLSQYDVGTIPPVLDSVIIGPVSAMRCQEAKHLFVLGALEGSLPAYAGSVGVLSDQERDLLRKLELPLTGGSIEGLHAEFAEIYGVFCGARNSVTVSCPSGRPSFIFRRLLTLAGDAEQEELLVGPALVDPLEAASLLLCNHSEDFAEHLNVDRELRQLFDHKDHAMGTVERQNVEKLYGKSLRLSASQIDKQADCKLAYFLKYGLRLKERKEASVDPAEFGTYVHAVLEETAKEIKALGGFKNVSLEQTLSLAAKYSEAYAQERFHELDSERIRYIFQKNEQELRMIVQELWEELQESDFSPVAFEAAFGPGQELKAISISGKTMDAQLMGFVDRVDRWDSGSGNYFRVIDYKTGKKDFDYCDVFNGYGLQMLLYLFALEEDGAEFLGDSPICAGVQYFPARVPMISADGHLTPEQAQKDRDKSWKRKGLLLNEDAVLYAMENREDPKRLCYTQKKDGSRIGDLASKSQLRLLKVYVFSLVGKMVDDIASGRITPDPYTRGSSHNACTYCPYGSVCHSQYVEGRRNYKAMEYGRFWEEIEKEVANRG